MKNGLYHVNYLKGSSELLILVYNLKAQLIRAIRTTTDKQEQVKNQLDLAYLPIIDSKLDGIEYSDLLTFIYDLPGLEEIEVIR